MDWFGESVVRGNFTEAIFYQKRYLAVMFWCLNPCYFCLAQSVATVPGKTEASTLGSVRWAQGDQPRQFSEEEQFSEEGQLFGGEQQSIGGRGFEITFPAMGTMVHLVAFSEDHQQVEAAFLAAQQKTTEIASILTDYDPQSESRRLPSQAADGPITVSQPLWDVLVAADKWYHQSGGALDCSIGMLTQLWRKYRRIDRVPDVNQVALALQDSGWKNVRLDTTARTVTLSHDRIRFDFGAIGKGYVIDQLFELLQNHGLKSCLVNISGDIRCGACPPGRKGWRVAVAALSSAEDYEQKLVLSDVAIATSGDLWQFQMINGEKRSHILDPSTGMGVIGPTSVTVIAPSAIDADALATVGTVMEWTQFKEMIQLLQHTEAMKIVQQQGQSLRNQTLGFPAAGSTVTGLHDKFEGQQ